MPPSRRLAGSGRTTSAGSASARDVSEKRQDRSTNIRIGLVGALAAILGSVVSGAISYVAARNQTAADEALRLRESRQVVYVQALTLFDAQVRKLGIMGDQLKAGTEASPADIAELDKGLADMRTVRASIQLIAPPAARQYVEDTYDHYVVLEAILKNDPLFKNERVPAYQDYLRGAFEGQGKFTTAAAADLGNKGS